MTDNKRILFVTSTLEVGGSETKVVRLANALADLEYSVSIAYLNPPETLLDRINSRIRVAHLQRRGKYSMKSLCMLRKEIENGYTLLACVNFYPLLYVVPAIKSVTSVNSPTACLINTTDFVDRQRFLGRFYAPFLRQCDRLVYGCKAQQELWTGKYRLPRERSTYIYNGVDVHHFCTASSIGHPNNLRAEFGIPEEAILIGGVGRLAPEKNFELLVKAVSRLNSTGRITYLLLVGDGTERQLLEETARSESIAENVFFSGVREDVRTALSAMDIFVLPSKAVETFSNAALEAMSMARPVVMTDIGGASEMIRHNQSGFLFNPGDLETLTDLLAALHDSKPERERIGQTARERVVEYFSFDKMVNNYRSLIHAT